MLDCWGVGADVLLGLAHQRKVKRLANQQPATQAVGHRASGSVRPSGRFAQLLDTFIEREKLKQRVNAQGA